MPRLILLLLPMLLLKQVLPQRSILTVIWMVMVLMSEAAHENEGYTNPGQGHGR